ncbi:MAG: DEAD/DEAH box helicase family protein [Clostridium sp.]|nr:DEAD/DEAH box helicase family protein [Clostridium sp.]
MSANFNYELNDKCLERLNNAKYKYQKESITEIIKRVPNGMPTLLVMPTGTGKTFTAMVACFIMLKKNEKNRIVWIAHRDELLTQASETLGNFGKEFEDRFTFIMRSKIKDKLEKREINTNTIVVIDEAHHSIATTYYLSNLKEKSGGKVLGLTATPFRTDDGDNGFFFADEFTNQCPWNIIERINLSEAISKGILKPYKLYNCFEKKGNIYDRYIDILSKPELLSDYSANLFALITEIIKESSGKTIVYAQKDDGDKLKKVLDEANKKIECYSLYSGIDSETRRKKVCQFHQNETERKKVIINNEILTEGFDDPDVSTIILLYDTNSRIKMTQIIGRGIRKSNKVKECVVYNFFATNVLEKVYDNISLIKDLNDDAVYLQGCIDFIEVNAETDEYEFEENSEPKIKSIKKKMSITKQALRDLRFGLLDYNFNGNLKTLLEGTFEEINILGVFRFDGMECIVTNKDKDYMNTGKYHKRFNSNPKLVKILENLYHKYQNCSDKEKMKFFNYIEEKTSGFFCPLRTNLAELIKVLGNNDEYQIMLKYVINERKSIHEAMKKLCIDGKNFINEDDQSRIKKDILCLLLKGGNDSDE